MKKLLPPPPAKILVCPLDWGLGHATRMVPLITDLQTDGYEVVLAADNAPLTLLKKEFPNLDFIKFPSYNISYSKKIPFLLKMFLQSPKIIFGIYKEHKQLEEIISKLKIDIVISDNRFGLWSRKAYCVYVTHQIFIKLPKIFRFAEFFASWLHGCFINRYEQCWIPDNSVQNSLSGELSHKGKLPRNALFIGTLSRFRKVNYEIKKERDLIVVLSGPEPQRTVFERIVLNQLKYLNLKTLLVRGKPDEKWEQPKINNLTVVNHLPSKELAEEIEKSENIICRSGYTSIMDLFHLQRTAILVPTPQQTEQEYLAKYLKEKRWFYSVSQKKFSVETALQEIKNYEVNFGS